MGQLMQGGAVIALLALNASKGGSWIASWEGARRSAVASVLDGGPRAGDKSVRMCDALRYRPTGKMTEGRGEATVLLSCKPGGAGYRPTGPGSAHLPKVIAGRSARWWFFSLHCSSQIFSA